MVVSPSDESLARIARPGVRVIGHRRGPGFFAGAQRDGRVVTFVSHDRAAIACQLGITILETAASLPLSLENGGVLRIAVVGAFPGLRHPGLR